MAKNWIQDAIKKPGSLTKTAKKAKAVSKNGTINADWLAKEAKQGGVTGKRARLAQTLRKMNKGK